MIRLTIRRIPWTALAGLAGVLLPAAANANSFVLPGTCCGDQHYSDCSARADGPLECRSGHQLTHIDDIGILDGCFGVGCIDGDISGQPCDPDVADGTATTCTANVRSCAAQAGSVTCGAPAAACVVPGANDIDFCPKPACVGGVINTADLDGDGLFDCWEDQGIDYDGDGTVDLDLPAYGVNKARKDVLVEIDYFDCAAGGDCAAGDVHTHRPTATAGGVMGSIETVQDAFNHAPFTNQSGVDGINLIVQVDEALPHQNNCALDNSCFSLLKATRLGTPAEHMNVNAWLAKRVTFHYNVWGHDLGPNLGYSGIANIFGGNFIVSLGTGWQRTIAEQAGTFMHELGHALGLGHGGFDATTMLPEHTNYKPNHLSVMNYSFQMGLLPLNNFDYSRAALPNLIEVAALSEPVGINDGMATTIYYCPNGTTQQGPGSGALNWDCKPLPNTATDSNLTLDINMDRRCMNTGPNNGFESPLGGDDFVAEGEIVAGPDGILSTVPQPLTDDMQVGNKIVPGLDGILQTRPQPLPPPAVNDDVVQGLRIWDGTNRKCESTKPAMGSDDAEERAKDSVQTPTLIGSNDWSAIKFDFSGELITIIADDRHPDQGAPQQEMDPDLAARLTAKKASSDVSVTQHSARNADGTITYTFTMTNAGPNTAVSPTMNDRVANIATPLSCSAQSPGTCKITGDYVAIAFPTIASGASVTAQLTIRINGTPAAGTQSVVNAELASTDMVRSNNKSTACLAPPSFTLVPANTTISSCTATNVGQPTATSLCGLPITITSNAPATYHLGVTTVTWTATDAEGNSQTATQKVTATLGDDPACCPVGTHVMMGTNGSDHLTGTPGSDCILGLGGNDIINANDGDDYISGGAGNDTINGGNGNDLIWGGAGVDTIDSSNGDDFIDGGADVDVCAGSAGINRIVSCTTVAGCTAACCSTNSCSAF